MTNRSTGRKIEWTDEQRAEHEAIRELSLSEAGRAQIMEQFEGHESSTMGTMMELLELAAGLRRARDGQGRTLAEVAERADMTRPQLSALENGRNPNPTLATLARWAQALGMQLTLGLEPLPPEEDS